MEENKNKDELNEQNQEEVKLENDEETKEEITEVKPEEIKKEEEIKPEEEKKEEPKQKKKHGRSIISKLFSMIFTIVFFGWVAVLLFDYYNVSQEKEPVFCIKEETKTYEDGTVNICTGLGYKVFRYNRQSYNALEFGPFWIGEKQPL